ncbi:hypothetical protein, partial [Aquimarina litoralis]|uniref:hypothetical protein n=1 Tax=Aquimarina litoralis TaxID=584605 RepID=UPI001C58FAD9
IGRAGIDNVECNVIAGAGNTNLSYDAATNTVQSDTGANATINLAVAGGNDGLLSGADKSKIDGIESNATADQTAAEIINAIDTELGNTSWQTSGSGLDTTQNLVLTDGDNLSPTFNIQNSFASDNYYLRMYFLNSIGYLESERLSDDAPTAMRFKGTYFGAYLNGIVDLGQSNLGWRDAWFTRKVTAGEFEIIGAPDGILMANGSINTDTYVQAKQNVVTNVNITLDLNDNYKRIRATTGTITYTIPLNTNVAFDPDDTEIIIYNLGATSVTIAVEDPSITLSGSAGVVLSSGDKRTLTKLDTDTWFVGY